MHDKRLNISQPDLVDGLQPFPCVKRLTLGWIPGIFANLPSPSISPYVGHPHDQSLEDPTPEGSLLRSSCPPCWWSINPDSTGIKHLQWEDLNHLTHVRQGRSISDIVLQTFLHMEDALDGHPYAPANEMYFEVDVDDLHNLLWPHPQLLSPIEDRVADGKFGRLFFIAWVAWCRMELSRPSADLRRARPSLDVLNLFSFRSSDSYYWTIDLSSGQPCASFIHPSDPVLQDVDEIRLSRRSAPFVVGSLLDTAMRHGKGHHFVPEVVR